MTKEERHNEILQAAQKQFPDIKLTGTKAMMAARRIEDFVLGAEWSDKNPYKQ